MTTASGLARLQGSASSDSERKALIGAGGLDVEGEEEGDRLGGDGAESSSSARVAAGAEGEASLTGTGEDCRCSCSGSSWSSCLDEDENDRPLGPTRPKLPAPDAPLALPLLSPPPAPTLAPSSRSSSTLTLRSSTGGISLALERREGVACSPEGDEEETGGVGLDDAGRPRPRPVGGPPPGIRLSVAGPGTARGPSKDLLPADDTDGIEGECDGDAAAAAQGPDETRFETLSDRSSPRSSRSVRSAAAPPLVDDNDDDAGERRPPIEADAADGGLLSVLILCC